jgi:hypothetical protein
MNGANGRTARTDPRGSLAELREPRGSRLKPD